MKRILVFICVMCLLILGGCKEKEEMILISESVGNVDDESKENETGNENGNNNDKGNADISHEQENESTDQSNKQGNDKSDLKQEDKDSGLPGQNNEENINENNKLIVFVCGAVSSPGVYYVNQNSRLIDAVDAAGGYSTDAAIEYINLAREIADGEKIYVPSYNDVQEAGNSEGATKLSEVNMYDKLDSNNDILNKTDEKAGSGSLININTAGEAELTSLPGIGTSKAKAIINYRENNGSFKKIEDIMEIPGIKEGLFNKVRDNICVN